MGLLLSVILVPAAEQHHYILLFPAFALAALSFNLSRIPLLAATALVAIPLAYGSKELSEGWWSLLAYPRLYGAILLYVILLFQPNGPKQNAITPGH
jgi:hypothetical protein